MRILRKILFYIFLLVFVVITSSLVIGYVYEKEVKQAVINRINEHLQAEIQVDRIDLNLLQKFPFASLDLEGTTLSNKTPSGKRDTLLYFDHVFLQFDVIDIFRKEHRIERISFEHGRVNIKVDRNGNVNLNIWEQKKDTTTSELALELDRIGFEDVKWTYAEPYRELHLAGYMSKGTFQGKFRKEKYTMNAELDGSLQVLRTRDVEWKDLSIDIWAQTGVFLNKEEEYLDINEGAFEWNGLKGNLKGKVENRSHGKELDISFNIPSQSVPAFLDVWPRRLRIPDRLDIKGRAEVSGAITGILGPHQTPTIECDLDVMKGRVLDGSTQTDLRKVSFKGHFIHPTRRGVPEFRVKGLSAKLGKGTINGKGVWTRSSSHEIEAFLNGSFDLGDAAGLLGVDTFEVAKGGLEVKAMVSGRFKDLSNITVEEVQRAKVAGKVDLSNGWIKLKKQKFLYREINGTFILHNEDAAVKDLSGKVAGSDFRVQGKAENFIPYLSFPEERLTVNADLEADRLDLDRILEENGEKGSSEEGAYKLKFPENMDLKLGIVVDELRFREFRASAIKGLFRLDNSLLQSPSFSLKTSDGKVDGRFSLRDKGNGYARLDCDVDLASLNIREVFRQFENFGQNFIADRHLRGTLQAQVHYESDLKDDLTIPQASVDAVADLTIQKGELVAFEPLIDLGEDLASRKLLKTFVEVGSLKKELEHIRFRDLENRVRINDQTVRVPEFQIRSNALDIDVSGTHTFDNRIEYHFMILLDEVLSKPKKSEFGYIKDEGSRKRLFVKMTGKASDPDLSFDRQAAREQRKKKVEKEKNTIKGILKEEFGLFKQDTSVTPHSQKEEKDEDAKPEFELDWGKEDDKKEKDKEKEKEKKSIWERLGIKDEEKKGEKNE